MEEGSIRDLASCDLDLHQVNKPIAARDRDASHARREVKLHRRLCSPFFTLATVEPPQLDAMTSTNSHRLTIPTIRSKPRRTNRPPTMTFGYRRGFATKLRSVPLGPAQICASSLWSSRRPHWKIQQTGCFPPI